MAVRFAVIVAALMLLTPVRLFAQGRPAPLQGVDTVTVKVSIAAPADILPHGLTEVRLQTLVELKLRGWGLQVMPAAEDAKAPGIRPHVELEITMLETRAVQKLAGYAFFVRLVVGEGHAVERVDDLEGPERTTRLHDGRDDHAPRRTPQHLVPLRGRGGRIRRGSVVWLAMRPGGSGLGLRATIRAF